MPNSSILLAAALAFAAGEAAAQSERERRIAPGDAHEECMVLASGKKLNYSFKTKTPVDFNIHYHLGNDVKYPVKRDAVKTGAGLFVADSRREYCMMWSNSSGQAATLIYRFAVE